MQAHHHHLQPITAQPIPFSARLYQFFCLHRERVRHFEAGRLATRCVHCGHVSPGIPVGGFRYNTAVNRSNRTWVKGR